MSLSECTHSNISQTAGLDTEPPTSPLGIILQTYDSQPLNTPIKQCLEMILANLSFSFSTHGSLISHSFYDILREQNADFEKYNKINLPIALLFINLEINPENLSTIGQSFLSCVKIAKEVKGITLPLKIRLLKAFENYLDFVKNCMSQFNANIFPLFEEYIIHIFSLEENNEELISTVIGILLNIVSSIPEVIE